MPHCQGIGMPWLRFRWGHPYAPATVFTRTCGGAGVNANERRDFMDGFLLGCKLREIIPHVIF